MQIVFSRRRTTADELIADLIAAEPAPRELVVVSSDHGVQRAARQRGIESHDSELWCRQLRERATQKTTTPADKPETAQSAADIQHWLQEFSPPAPHLKKQAKTKPQDER
jgi:predicted RNA-binding protein with PIN domain